MNWSTYHRSDSQNTKNVQLLSLCIFLASFFTKWYLGPCLWFILFWESRKPSGASSNTNTQDAKYFPPSGSMNYLQPVLPIGIAL